MKLRDDYVGERNDTDAAYDEKCSQNLRLSFKPHSSFTRTPYCDVLLSMCLFEFLFTCVHLRVWVRLSPFVRLRLLYRAFVVFSFLFVLLVFIAVAVFVCSFFFFSISAFR